MSTTEGYQQRRDSANEGGGTSRSDKSAFPMRRGLSANALGSTDSIPTLAPVGRSWRAVRWKFAVLLKWKTITGTSGLPSLSQSIEPKSGPVANTMSAAKPILVTREIHSLPGLKVIVRVVHAAIVGIGHALSCITPVLWSSTHRIVILITAMKKAWTSGSRIYGSEHLPRPCEQR